MSSTFISLSGAHTLGAHTLGAHTLSVVRPLYPRRITTCQICPPPDICIYIFIYMYMYRMCLCERICHLSNMYLSNMSSTFISLSHTHTRHTHKYTCILHIYTQIHLCIHVYIYMFTCVTHTLICTIRRATEGL